MSVRSEIINIITNVFGAQEDELDYKIPMGEQFDCTDEEIDEFIDELASGLGIEICEIELDVHELTLGQTIDVIIEEYDQMEE